MTFHWAMLWQDEQGRSWATEPFKAETPHEARKLHAASMRGDWVKEGMYRPYVTPLFYYANGYDRAVADGGPVGSGASQEPLRASETRDVAR